VNQRTARISTSGIAIVGMLAMAIPDSPIAYISNSWDSSNNILSPLHIDVTLKKAVMKSTTWQSNLFPHYLAKFECSAVCTIHSIHLQQNNQKCAK